MPFIQAFSFFVSLYTVVSSQTSQTFIRGQCHKMEIFCVCIGLCIGLRSLVLSHTEELFLALRIHVIDMSGDG